mmetsp:Transcript_75956/g.209608  ORF Transcript_75956/g.209608 Transcript_75956/m.209608 type:complete len:433 (+) Transcript_75956:39-1337(+)
MEPFIKATEGIELDEGLPTSLDYLSEWQHHADECLPLLAKSASDRKRMSSNFSIPEEQACFFACDGASVSASAGCTSEESEEADLAKLSPSLQKSPSWVRDTSGRSSTEGKSRTFSFGDVSTLASTGEEEEDSADVETRDPAVFAPRCLPNRTRIVSDSGIIKEEQIWNASTSSVSTLSAEEEEEEEEDADCEASFRFASWARRRSMSSVSILEVTEEPAAFADDDNASCSSGQEEQDVKEALQRPASQDQLGTPPAREHILSVMSIPEEWPASANPPSERSRGSSDMIFPLNRHVDNYDPRNPENIQPATEEQIAAYEIELIRRQIGRLAGLVASREAAEPNSEVLEGYRQAICEMRWRAWRLEVNPRCASTELLGATAPMPAGPCWAGASGPSGAMRAPQLRPLRKGEHSATGIEGLAGVAKALRSVFRA